MKIVSKRTKIVSRIAAATTTVILSLAVTVIGTYAWFSTQQTTTVEGMSFMVTVDDTKIEPLRLIKFDYASQEISGIEVFDYLKPGDGQANTYTYSETYNKFLRLYDDKEASIMNPYDPVDQFIHGDDLRSMNCNSIYEVTIVTSKYTNCYLQLDAIYHPKSAGRDEILLSDSVDFEIFYPSDLRDDNPLFKKGVDDYTGYLPDYSIKSPQDDGNEDDDEIYHKISYLSYLRNPNITAEKLVELGLLTSEQIAGKTEEQKETLIRETVGPVHKNFYSEVEKSTVNVAKNVPVTFSGEPKTITVYINVNYAPKQLEQYSTDIYTKNLTAIDDFYFGFDFTTEAIA